MATAVDDGIFVSALEHFLEFGAKESRSGLGFEFSESAYLDANPDVANAVQEGIFDSGLEHFILFGFEEDRDPAPGDSDDSDDESPNEADAYNYRGQARYQQGDLEGTISDLTEVQKQASFAVKYYEKELDKFYKNNFSDPKQLNLLAGLVEYIYQNYWKDNEEKKWAQKMLSTSKAKYGTSNEDIYRELVNWIFQLIQSIFPTIMKIAKEEQGTQLSNYEQNLILKELPIHLGGYYFAFLHYDIVNGRFQSERTKMYLFSSENEFPVYISDRVLSWGKSQGLYNKADLIINVLASAQGLFNSGQEFTSSFYKKFDANDNFFYLSNLSALIEDWEYTIRNQIWHLQVRESKSKGSIAYLNLECLQRDHTKKQVFTSCLNTKYSDFNKVNLEKYFLVNKHNDYSYIDT